MFYHFYILDICYVLSFYHKLLFLISYSYMVTAFLSKGACLLKMETMSDSKLSYIIVNATVFIAIFIF